NSARSSRQSSRHPARADRAHILVLACIDLDFQFQSRRRLRLGYEAVDQMHGVTRLLTAWFTEPGQGLANGIDGRPDRLGPHLDQVDILCISQWLAEQQLVNCSAAPECD